MKPGKSPEDKLRTMMCHATVQIGYCDRAEAGLDDEREDVFHACEKALQDATWRKVSAYIPQAMEIRGLGWEDPDPIYDNFKGVLEFATVLWLENQPSVSSKIKHSETLVIEVRI